MKILKLSTCKTYNEKLHFEKRRDFLVSTILYQRKKVTTRFTFFISIQKYMKKEEMIILGML